MEKKSVEELLDGYPATLQIPVAWGEMDALGHVNNVVYIRYLESGRIAYFVQMGLSDFMGQAQVGPILASIQCRYKSPVTFPDTLVVGTRVTALGEDRMTMHHRVVSTRQKRIVAEGEGIVVSYDYHARKKAPLPANVRARVLEVERLDAVPVAEEPSS